MIEISIARLSVMLVPLLLIGWLAHRWARLGEEVGWASLRMIVQLLAVGYVLVALFALQNPWAALGVLAFMVTMSSIIAVRTVKTNKQIAWRDALLAILLGGGSVLAVVTLGVLDLKPWYQLDKMIPIAGMIFSNAMTAITLGADRWQAERAAGHGIEKARATAWRASLIPQMNAFMAVGLVALPGMMTGQILAGVSPLMAVRYQILVMSMVLSSAGFSVAIFLARTIARERGETKD
jgi:putative ABC transport system permease protein